MRLFASISSICFFILISCTDDIQNYPVGSDFIDNDASLMVIDTFSIKTGTFKLDSLITSSTNRILLGSIDDDYFGHLNAQSYFQVENSNYTIDDDTLYDSIGFVLKFDTYYYGDTTQVQTYKLHQILETVEPEDNDFFFNTTKLDYDAQSLGELTFTPRPNKSTDSLYIPLDNTLGEAIFNKIKDNEINNTDDFLQFFKGITIIPDTLSNSHVLGFKFLSNDTSLYNNSYMRLFYTQEDNDEDYEETLDFYISSSDKQFNAINSNLENTLLGDFEDVETIIMSEQTNNLFFAQAGTGISGRIEIPTLKKLNEFSNQSTSLEAELTFAPLSNSYGTNKPLKDSLAVYIIDHRNRIVSQLVDNDSVLSYAILNQNDDEFDNNTYYSIDMSGFVETILNSTYDLNYALMIQLIDYEKTAHNLVIDNTDNENNKVKMSVTFLNY